MSLRSRSESLLQGSQHSISDGLLNHLDLTLSSVFVSLKIDLSNLFVTSFLLFEPLKSARNEVRRINEQICTGCFGVIR